MVNHSNNLRRGMFLAAAITTLLVGQVGAAQTACLVSDSKLDPPAQFALDELAAALQEKSWAVKRIESLERTEGDLIIVVGVAQTSVLVDRLTKANNIVVPKGPESLAVKRTAWRDTPMLVVCGSDSRGLMYAALDVAERISWAVDSEPLLTHVHDISEKPDLLERSLSIYTMHRTYFERRLFDEAYWERYFELLARCRFNSFVVIFGYENGGFMAPPYPYFFDVEGFSDVRLIGITQEQQRKNVQALKRLIACAHRHGIDFVPGIWDHIYRGGVQGGGIRGADQIPQQPTPGLVWGVTADNLASYNKAAIAKFLDVFPEIDGIQFRMHGESGLRRDEIPRFWHEIFQIIKRQRPELRVDIRAKGLPDEVIDDGLRQGIRLRVATKYWMEQMGLPFHPTHVNPPNQRDRRHGYADLLTYPQRYKVHWRLWNGGTTRVLLWGDPVYARRFAASAHLYNGNSFEVNEPLATKMLARPHDEEPFDLLGPDYQYYDWEFERYWHFFQVFGRLGYNPETPAEIWQREFVRRFGDEAGPCVMRGLHLASQVLPRIVAASYRYRYFPTTRGWAEKMRIDDLPTYATAEGSDVQQFADFRDEARRILKDGESARRRPAETSRWFTHISQAILEQVSLAESKIASPPSREFVSTMTDLKILAYLALYHARRMPAAVNYNLFRETQDLWSLDAAIAGEKDAADAWEKIVEAAGDVYASDLSMGIAHGGLAGHWKDELARLRDGINQLEQQRTAFKPNLDGADMRVIHVPLRRSLPRDAVSIRATVFSQSDPSRRAVHRDDITRTTTRIRHAATRGPGGTRQTCRCLLRGKPPCRIGSKRRGANGQRVTFPQSGCESPIQLRVSNDRQPPKVELDPPAEALIGKSIRITARASDASGVKWMRLRYRHLTQFEDYETAEMVLDEQSGRFVAEIPAEFVISRWDIMYFVEAMDREGNGRMYPDLEHEMPYVIVHLQDR